MVIIHKNSEKKTKTKKMNKKTLLSVNDIILVNLYKNTLTHIHFPVNIN